VEFTVIHMINVLPFTFIFSMIMEIIILLSFHTSFYLILCLVSHPSKFSLNSLSLYLTIKMQSFHATYPEPLTIISHTVL